MIIVENPGDGKHFTVRFSGTQFWHIKNIMSLQSAGAYRKKEKLWYIPHNVLDPFLNDIRVRFGDEERMHISESAQTAYDNWNTLIQKRIRAKTEGHLPDISDYFKAKKFPRFQELGANFLYRNRFAIVGDRTGSGKTVMTLAATVAGIIQNQYAKIIFLCEPDAKEKMAGEVVKFTDWRTFIAHGPPKKRYAIYNDFLQDPDPGYLIMAYSTARIGIIRPNYRQRRYVPDYSNSEVKILMDALGNLPYGMIIDEVQNCKHHNSLQSFGTQYLMKKANCCYGASATYIEGRLTELFGVFRIIRPTVFSTPSKFENRHVNKSAFAEKDKWIRVREAKMKTEPYVIRRKEFDDEGVLPKEDYKDYWVTLTKKQRELYRAVMEEEQKKRNEYLEKLATKRGCSVGDILGFGGDALWRMIRERQCCLFPETIDPDLEGESPKFDELVRLIDEFPPNDKIIIFCHFQKPVELLITRLNDYWRTIGLHGGMKVDVEDIKRQYMTDPDIKILVTSDKLQKSHDLNAGRVLINFDVLWNPAWMTQRKGRITRAFGKFDQVLIYTILTRNTVEDYMFNEVLEPKRKMMTDYMDDGTESRHITREAIEVVYERYRG